jgi:vacuolar-type H+-ATPase subunit H
MLLSYLYMKSAAMKKVLRIVGITIGVILLLLILIPILFRARIEATVKQKINENVHATVDWSRFGVTLFRGFPDLSINLHGVSVVGLDPFEGDTLMGLERFEVRVNPFSALRKNVIVKSILLDRPLVNAIVLEDGTANWDIAVETGEQPGEVTTEKEETEETGSVEPAGGDQEASIAVSLKKFAISKGRISYRDAAMGAEAAIQDFNLELAGDFSLDETELDLGLDIRGVDATYGGIRYLHNATLGMDLAAAAEMVEERYSMLENEIRINGLVLGIEGVVDMMEDGGMDMDLRFFTRETTFKTLLSMVPAIYLEDFASLQTRGSLALEGTVRGIMKDSLMPDATVTLAVEDGYFAYPDLPKDVSDVQIKLKANYNGKDMDLSTVDLERFHLLLGSNPFEARMKVDHPVSDMHVAGSVKGLVDFATLRDVVPMENLQMNGKLTADLVMDTRMSTIQQERYEEVGLDGKLLIEGVEVESPDIPVPVDLHRMELNFNPRFVELAELSLNLGTSDLRLTGELSNFIPYVFKGETVSGRLNVTSQLLDINELMPAEETPEQAGVLPSTDTLAGPEPVPPDSLAEPVQTKIPENIDFTLGLDLGRVEYDKILVENVKGSMRVSEGVAHLDDMQMDVIEGRITADGSVDTRGEFTEADLALDMLGVDIPSSYETFVTVERLAPMAKYCRGSANINLKLKTLLDASFAPLYGSLNADGKVFTRNVQVYNTKSFVRLSELLKNEKFREMAPDDMNIRFRVRNGRVLIDPFDMNFEGSKITVSGSHGIDMTLDYLMDMKIAKSDLGEGVNDLMKGVAALAAGAGIKVPESDFILVKARITGTFNDPKVATDLSGNLGKGKESVKEVVIEAVEEKVMEEVEKVEEQVREEASQKADEIMKEAEQEAAKIMEDARRAGDELVKEAKRQGDQLVKEAGNNPLKKVAAQRTADEMVNQARKKSDALLQEAQLKSDEVLKKAREEAGRI